MADPVVFQNAHDEKSVLADALAHASSRALFARILGPEDFSVPEFKVIAYGLRRLAEANVQPEPKAFHVTVEDSPFGVAFGGVETLHKMMATAPRPMEPTAFSDLCGRVRTFGTKMRAAEHLVQANALVANPSSTLEELRIMLAAASQVIDSAESHADQGFRNPTEINAAYASLMRDRIAGLGFRSTGFPHLDEIMLQGFLPGQITVLAARPSIGKSTFADNIAHAYAQRGVGSVGFFSNEAPEEAIWDKFNSISTGIPLRRLYRDAHLLSIPEKKVLHLQMGRRTDWPLWINDDKVFSMATLERTLAQRAAAGTKFDLVIIDLFDRASEIQESQNKGNAAGVIKNCMTTMQRLADRYQFHALVLAQLGRYEGEGKTGTGKGKSRMIRPTENNLYGADGWRQIADNVILLHRAHHYQPILWPNDVLEVDIRKQRYGEPCIRCFEFEKETGRIKPTALFPVDFTDEEREKYKYEQPVADFSMIA